MGASGLEPRASVLIQAVLNWPALRELFLLVDLSFVPEITSFWEAALPGALLVTAPEGKKRLLWKWLAWLGGSEVREMALDY